MRKKTDKNIGLAVWIGGITVLAAALVLLSNLVLGGFYYDLTSDGRYSLDGRTEAFLKDNKQPVAVRLYVSKGLIGQNQALGYYADYVRRLLEEYRRKSGGVISVSVVETVPFASTQAAAEEAGITAFDAGGKKNVYLGASFTNSRGQTAVIPRFLPERQRNVEDDITRTLSILLQDKKPVLGVISPFFKVTGSSSLWGFSSGWPFIEHMKSFGYDIRPLNTDTAVIPKDVDAVLVFYPVRLKDEAVYALDQYLLGGGRIIMVLDAFSDERFRKSGDYEPYASGVEAFLQKKGVKYVSDTLAGDAENSREAVWEGQSKKYPFWLTADAGAKRLFLNHSGFFDYTPQEGFSTEVLASTGGKSAVMPPNAVLGVDMSDMEKSYRTSSEKYPLILLLEGNFASIFDEAQIFANGTQNPQASFLSGSEREGKLLLIADSDMFTTSLWSANPQKKQRFYDEVFISDNVHFLRDMADYLSGGGLAGAEPKAIGRGGRSLDNVFYGYAVDKFALEKTAAMQKLADIQNKIAVLRRQLKAVPVASVKQTKDLEQLRREEIDAQENLRRIAYQTGELHKNLSGYFSFFATGILPLLTVLLVGGVYGAFRLRIKRKAEKHVEA